jgi:SAM-dependent methyltransferase
VKRRLLERLCCPDCGGALAVDREADDIVEGMLRCVDCGASYPVRAGIPRFVRGSGYASSFGLQWNLFRLEQIDDASGTELSRRRFFTETEWTPASLAGTWVLDAGCGAGRFLAIAAQTGAEVVGLDLSDAVDAAAKTLGHLPNVHLVQGRVERPPFRAGSFDSVYCIGVIQHTSDPEASVRAIASLVRAGGRLAITAYERRRFTMLYSKYFARRLTRGLSDRALLRLVYVTMPILFPLTEVLFRIPVLGRLFRFVIPVANYVDAPLSVRQRYRWALLDTYDMLAPRYDQPQREDEVRRWLGDAGIRARRLANTGLNLVGTKAPPA